MRLRLPTLVNALPISSRRVHEIKWDEYRVSAYVNGNAAIRTRSGRDNTRHFPTIAATLAVGSAVLHGRVVILESAGAHSSANSRPTRPARLEARRALGFGLLVLNGGVLWTRPLKKRLRSAIAGQKVKGPSG